MLLERELIAWSYDYLDGKRIGKQGHLGSSLETREVPDLGCSEPGLVMKASVEYCFYLMSLKEHGEELPARLRQQWTAVEGAVLTQHESQ